jgi:hypothetical protein
MKRLTRVPTSGEIPKIGEELGYYDYPSRMCEVVNIEKPALTDLVPLIRRSIFDNLSLGLITPKDVVETAISIVEEAGYNWEENEDFIRENVTTIVNDYKKGAH